MFGKIRSNQPRISYSKYKTVPDKKLKIKNKLKAKEELMGSQFRILNEILYTSDSKTAVQYFQYHKYHYDVYHEGFRKQSEGWAMKPVDRIITMLESEDLSQKKIIDLGCGEGAIEEQLGERVKRIRSYDLVSCKPHVIVADIAHLPLKSSTQDIAIFCLSLMGTNYMDFILYAFRVLKIKGRMMIAEVESRCLDWPAFLKMLYFIGMKTVSSYTNKYFRIMVLQKKEESEVTSDTAYQKRTLSEVSRELLHPCIYKKR